MATLITGGSGFVGLAVAARLLEGGGVVVLFSREPVSPELLRRLPGGRLHVVTGDIRSPTELMRACDNLKVTDAVHLAAVTPGIERERADPEAIVSVNVLGTVALIKALAARGPRRIVVLSSIAVYGFADPGPDGRYRADRNYPAPSALYGITKLAAEQAALRLGELYGMDVRVVRLGPVYGPWEHESGVRDVMSPHRQVLQCALAGTAAVLPRPMRADWIYAQDAADGILHVLRAPALTQRIFDLGGETVTDLVEWCRALAARRPDTRWRVATDGEAPNVLSTLSQDRAPLDNTHLLQETGFRPRFDVDAAAADYLAWLGETG